MAIIITSNTVYAFLCSRRTIISFMHISTLCTVTFSIWAVLYIVTKELTLVASFHVILIIDFTWCWKKVLSCSRSKCKLQMYFGEHLSNLFWKGIFTIWYYHTQFKSWQQLRDNAAKIINYLKKCSRHDNVSYWIKSHICAWYQI